MKTAVSMMQWMKAESVTKRKAEKMDKNDLEGKLIVGDFQNKSESEFTEQICKLLEDRCTTGKPSSVKSAFQGD